MAHRHPFRFGVLAEHVQTRDALIGTARSAEEMGYATFLIRDHFLEEPFGHQLAPLAALATVAAVTERLRIGTLVIANDYRPPVLLAKEAATLDLLSGGRFELGLGTGFLRAEYEQAGIPFDPPGVRVDRFAESLTVLKGLFAAAPSPSPGSITPSPLSTLSPSRCSARTRRSSSARAASGCSRWRRGRRTSSASSPPRRRTVSSRPARRHAWRRPSRSRSNGSGMQRATGSTP